MRLEAHVAATAPLMGLAWAQGAAWPFLAGLVLGGVLVDADHVVEFWHDCGFSLSPSRFFAYGNSGTNSLHVVFLHSFEVLGAALLAAWAGVLPGLFLAFSLGLGVHLLLDYVNILRRFNFKWYSFVLFFFVFRAMFGFRRDSLDGLLRHDGGYDRDACRSAGP